MALRLVQGIRFNGMLQIFLWHPELFHFKNSMTQYLRELLEIRRHVLVGMQARSLDLETMARPKQDSDRRS
jgi:hypothetical protein